jgi:hypothetical protein
MIVQVRDHQAESFSPAKGDATQPEPVAVVQAFCTFSRDKALFSPHRVDGEQTNLLSTFRPCFQKPLQMGWSVARGPPF